MDPSVVQMAVCQGTSGSVFFTVGNGFPWSNLASFLLLLGVIEVGIQKLKPQVPPKCLFRTLALRLIKLGKKKSLQHKRTFQELAVKHEMPWSQGSLQG